MSTTLTTEDQTLTRLIAKRDQARAELKDALRAVVAPYAEAEQLAACVIRPSDTEAMARFLDAGNARMAELRAA